MINQRLRAQPQKPRYWHLMQVGILEGIFLENATYFELCSSRDGVLASSVHLDDCCEPALNCDREIIFKAHLYRPLPGREGLRGPYPIFLQTNEVRYWVVTDATNVVVEISVQ